MIHWFFLNNKQTAFNHNWFLLHYRAGCSAARKLDIVCICVGSSVTVLSVGSLTISFLTLEMMHFFSWTQDYNVLCHKSFKLNYVNCIKTDCIVTEQISLRPNLMTETSVVSLAMTRTMFLSGWKLYERLKATINRGLIFNLHLLCFSLEHD